jgi:uncharacterized protein
MIALLSPAKTLDFSKPVPGHRTEAPRLLAEAEVLAASAARLSAKRLGQIMHISPKLATLNVERFRGFADAPERAAIFAFAGDVYTGLAARSMSETGLAHAAGHLRILSGLYGLLRPFDLIRPYRLEMGTGWAPGRAKDLYGFWKDRIADLLAADLSDEGSGILVNLASREYFEAVEQHRPARARILTVDFREESGDGLRFNSFVAKKMRGAMARFICEERIERVEDLCGFEAQGYRFAGEPQADTLLFVRGATTG